MIDQIKYAVSAVAAQAHPTLTSAAVSLVRMGWKDTPSSSAGDTGLLAPASAFDVVGAASRGKPPVFGQFGNCHAERRCVGCERACGDETALVELVEQRRRPLLLVIAGLRGGVPSWLRVIAVAPAYSWSGKVFIPVLFRDPGGLTLACDDGGKSLVVRPGGLETTSYKAGTPWQVAAFDRALRTFSRAIPQAARAQLATIVPSVAA